jgi:hypothetical protein
MDADSCLILYGNSVFLAGIKADLERRVALELITIEAGRQEVTDMIRRRKPRAVLFDMALAQPEFAVSLWREHPGLLMIGVDPSSDELLVLSSHQARALSVADLVNVIR